MGGWGGSGGSRPPGLHVFAFSFPLSLLLLLLPQTLIGNDTLKGPNPGEKLAKHDDEEKSNEFDIDALLCLLAQMLLWVEERGKERKEGKKGKRERKERKERKKSVLPVCLLTSPPERGK